MPWIGKPVSVPGENDLIGPDAVYGLLTSCLPLLFCTLIEYPAGA